MIDEVSSNLFEFYWQIGENPGFSRGNAEGFSWVRSFAYDWPSFILGGGNISESSMARINDLMSKGKVPGFWIREESDDPGFEEMARKYGIRKVNYWRGMKLITRKSPLNEISMPEGSISQIHSMEELNDWVELVNTELLSGKKISPSIFSNSLEKSEFDFWKVTVENKIISTLLVFHWKAVSGIYLVATHNEYRGKGYGTWIVSAAMDYYIKKGNHTFVLHSTRSGYPLYKRLGFQDEGEYGIYWKVGKV